MNSEYKPISNLWKDSKGYRYFGTLKLSSKIKYDGDDFIPLWEWVEKLQQENKNLNGTIQTYNILLKSNVEENQELKKHLKVPENCNLKTLEDYKSYYEDTTREQILEDSYIDYCAYVNLAHRYSKLEKQLEEYQKELDETMSEKIDLEQENKQLKDNWIKLKDFIAKEYYMHLSLEASTKSITILIDKMKELEAKK